MTSRLFGYGSPRTPLGPESSGLTGAQKGSRIPALAKARFRRLALGADGIVSFERHVWTFQTVDREAQGGARCPMQEVTPILLDQADDPNQAATARSSVAPART